MGAGGRRGVAAAGTVAVAAGTNVATGMLTQHWAVAWWAATVVLVMVGGGVAWWLSVSEGRAAPSRVSAPGAGAIAAGGSVRDAATKVSLPPTGPGRVEGDPGAGVNATGPGAIAAGSDVDGARTEVSWQDPATA